MALRSLDKHTTVTIANGTAVSGAVEIPNGFAIAGIQFPSAWTAADLCFQWSPDESTFMDVIDPARAAATSFARITGIPTGAVSFGLTPQCIYDRGTGQQWKLTSINTASNAAVNQGGDRTLIVYIGRVTGG